jgi:hypothetical protein
MSELTREDRLRRDQLAFACDLVVAHQPKVDGNRVVCRQGCTEPGVDKPVAGNWPCDSHRVASGFIADQQLAEARA